MQTAQRTCAAITEAVALMAGKGKARTKLLPTQDFQGPHRLCPKTACLERPVGALKGQGRRHLKKRNLRKRCAGPRAPLCKLGDSSSGTSMNVFLEEFKGRDVWWIFPGR